MYGVKRRGTYKNAAKRRYTSNFHRNKKKCTYSMSKECISDVSQVYRDLLEQKLKSTKTLSLTVTVTVRLHQYIRILPSLYISLLLRCVSVARHSCFLSANYESSNYSTFGMSHRDWYWGPLLFSIHLQPIYDMIQTCCQHICGWHSCICHLMYLMTFVNAWRKWRNVLKSLHWFAEVKRIHFKVWILVYRALHHQAPEYLREN